MSRDLRIVEDKYPKRRRNDGKQLMDNFFYLKYRFNLFKQNALEIYFKNHTIDHKPAANTVLDPTIH